MDARYCASSSSRNHEGSLPLLSYFSLSLRGSGRSHFLTCPYHEQRVPQSVQLNAGALGDEERE